MPGVVYSRQVDFTLHGPVVLNVLSAPRPGGLYSVRAVLSNGAIQGRERLTDLEKKTSGSSTVVGVDGDFFNTSWGTPLGLVIQRGVLAAGAGGTRSAAGFDAAGGLHVDRVSLQGSWKGTGQYWALGLNTRPSSGTTLYTPAWGPTTPPETGTLEAVLEPFPAAVPNSTLSAPVVRVAEGGGVLQRVELPEHRAPFAVMLGGPDRRTLFILTAEWRPADHYTKNLQRLSHGSRTGEILTLPVSVPGAGRP
jgi:hypothetical protein